TNAILLPFGGDGTSRCLQAIGNGVQLAPLSRCTTFFFDGQTIKAGSLCLDIHFGDLAAGVLDVTTCNGTINQQWYFSGGQIVSRNQSDGQTHCLDVTNGSHNYGTPIGVVPCNQTAAQSFWPGGLTMKFPGAFIDSGGLVPECLDVLFDNE